MKHEQLLLQNQLCFPLYASSKLIISKYKQYLDDIDLTYTQYITMMVLWEHQKLSVNELGEYVLLDSGTLTPLLKRLEQKGFVSRTRNKDDERKITISLTKDGLILQDKAKDIPYKIASCFDLEEDESKVLYKLLYKLIQSEKHK